MTVSRSALFAALLLTTALTLSLVTVTAQDISPAETDTVDQCSEAREPLSDSDESFLFRGKMTLIPVLFIVTALATAAPWMLQRLDKAV